ncbi:hypothetical protein D3H55_08795 [Bacillus salacetis]|uniref:Uncharacterized protein n=1 Tax=Bacillus salacetis TaxID=2315464 RepID=A0A3A1R6M1_9BACI|nr:hypothetical protein D3H55_08795 [Bacillus salacetis]
MNDDELLDSYKKIWNNRELSSLETDASKILEEAVIRELKDENSHPRVRRSLEAKFYFAVKRITESSLSLPDRYSLIEYYISKMEELRMEQ